MAPQLSEIIDLINTRQDEIQDWFVTEFSRLRPPFYCSVDLRASNSKIVPVDANLFPGGFNNLDSAALARGAAAARGMLADLCPKAGRLLVVTEAHTRNRYYADSLDALGRMLRAAGADVRFALLRGPAVSLIGTRSQVPVSALERRGDLLCTTDFEPEAILLNNDLSGGLPVEIDGVRQPVLPPLRSGWATRRKSTHFFHYERVAERFALCFGFDPWLISPYFNVCNRVDINRNVGLDCLSTAVTETISDINANYRRFGRSEKPFVVLKADAGTYGMGVVMVEDAARVRRLNRRERNSLTTVKDSLPVRDILIQEGVESVDTVAGAVAEPVSYLVAGAAAGCFWRVNSSKSARANLNSRGMSFKTMATASKLTLERLVVYETVARLAVLATAREIAGDSTST